MPAIITPLNEKGKLLEESLRKLIDYTIDGGVHGLFVLGTTGEFYGLDLEEKRKIFEVAIDQADGRVPVYVGASEITTKDCIKNVQLAESCGVDGVSVLTPYFITPNQQELKEHFEKIAKATKLPMMLYNNVGRTNVDISPDIVEKLAGIDNIVGIKDSSGDMTKMSEYIRRTQDKKFNVFCGKDTLIYGALCYGGSGAVAATANIVPHIVSGIYNAFKDGNLKKARALQFELAPLRMAFTLSSFPGVMKEALRLVGIDPGVSLSPIGGIIEPNKEKMIQILKDLEVYQIIE
ncbi:MAG: 4-hydroxy-tetrahydrodipicolinate synthase [Clostridia bacterium]|nr:4-hydroxy-tetrahydrodipicolinate synthase [Clostridia bacterium]